MPTISGQTFLFTGTLTEFTRAEAEGLAKDNGGSVLSGVTSKLNFLVVGSDAGSKLDKAKALGTVKIITEKEFLKMVPKSGAAKSKPVSKTPAKKAAVKASKVAAKKAPATKTTKTAKVVKSDPPNPFEGKKFYFLCMFEVTKDLYTMHAKQIVEEFGGIVENDVTSDLDYVVRSSSDTSMSALMQTRLQEAKDYGTIKIINGKAFEKMIPE